MSSNLHFNFHTILTFPYIVNHIQPHYSSFHQYHLLDFWIHLSTSVSTDDPFYSSHKIELTEEAAIDVIV